MNIDHQVEAMKKRLTAKPPDYNEACRGCKERAYSLESVLVTVQDILGNVLEIYKLLEESDANIDKLSELSKTQSDEIEKLKKEIARLEGEAKAEHNSMVNMTKPALDLVAWYNMSKKTIATVIAAGGFITAAIIQIPPSVWERIVRLFLGG